jgi:hypothetical protein
MTPKEVFAMARCEWSENCRDHDGWDGTTPWEENCSGKRAYKAWERAGCKSEPHPDWRPSGDAYSPAPPRRLINGYWY